MLLIGTPRGEPLLKCGEFMIYAKYYGLQNTIGYRCFLCSECCRSSLVNVLNPKQSLGPKAVSHSEGLKHIEFNLGCRRQCPRKVWHDPEVAGSSFHWPEDRCHMVGQGSRLLLRLRTLQSTSRSIDRQPRKPSAKRQRCLAPAVLSG